MKYELVIKSPSNYPTDTYTKRFLSFWAAWLVARTPRAWFKHIGEFTSYITDVATGEVYYHNNDKSEEWVSEEAVKLLAAGVVM